MAELNLSKYGITGTTEVVHNPSYDLLFEEETKSTNEGYEKGQVSELGAVNVMTGVYTGRSPKDKYIVMDENSKNTVWWTSEGLLRREQGHPHGCPLHRGSGVAGAFRQEHVHPAL